MKRALSDSGSRERDLVRKAQRGSAEAFAELVARYQDRVYNTCCRLCHDRSAALDLTQTTFLKALEALPRFEARAGFYTWLYRIAVNLALTERRARRRRQNISLDDPDAHGRSRAPAAPPQQENPGRKMEREETHARVEAALASLDADFRAAVVLKDVEGLDYATIAAILQVPVGTVKSRIYRGRTLLREALSAERTELGTG